MIFKEGYWWPDCIRDKDVSFALNQLPYATALVQHCKKTGLLIQAGGCVGLYPIEQSRYFDRVLTFEPDPENHACLTRNVEERGVQKRVSVSAAALTETTGPVKLAKRNYSTHSVGDEGRDVSGFSIDQKYYHLEPDALQLDVEGHEIHILRGAIETIQRCRPVIQVEELKTDTGEVRAFLEGLGYAPQERKHGKDRIYLP